MSEAITNGAAGDQLKADQKMDAIMGILLRSGVVLAAAIVLVGGILFLMRHKTPVTDYHIFSGEPSDLRTISGIFSDVKAFRARGLIQLGLLVLIATPVARVVFSLFAFIYQKDWKYAVFTAIVLGLLLYSLLGSAGA
jgi:uncharacterized membrane protein